VLRVTVAIIILTPATIGTSQAQTRPLTDTEKKIILSGYSDRLKDPSSAQYRWQNLVVNQPSMAKPDTLIYWFRANAKNSYGGYVGLQIVLGTVTQRKGTVVEYTYKMGAESNPVMNDAAAKLCETAGYKFP